MEMSSGCPRQEAPAQAHRPSKPVRGPHGGWQKQEIEALQKSIDEATQAGESLRSVFERVGRELGRKPNSIRNFYYAQVRARGDDSASRALPFETFAPDEVEQLIENVLTARAQGMSVRACVRRLADGDRTRMLRYQNKYRSTVRTRPELVQRVMQRLSEDGIPYVNPYASSDGVPQAAAPEQGLAPLRQRARQSGDPQLVQLFSSLDYLMNLALTPRQAAERVPEEEQTPAFPAESEALRRADRLSAQCDMLRIRLSDEQERHVQLRSEAEGMVTLIKEYIALPETDRMSHCGAFCQQAAARLSAVECALMEEEP